MGLKQYADKGAARSEFCSPFAVFPSGVGSGYPHVFVGLHGDVPARMRFGVFDDLGDHPVVTTPFGLQVEHTLRRYFRGVLFGPPEIVGRFDDDFQFAGAGEYAVYRRLLFFGRQADPVEPAAQRMRSGSFEKYFESAGRELFGQVIQRIQRRFAAGNDDRLRRERAGAASAVCSENCSPIPTN